MAIERLRYLETVLLLLDTRFWAMHERYIRRFRRAPTAEEYVRILEKDPDEELVSTKLLPIIISYESNRTNDAPN